MRRWSRENSSLVLPYRYCFVYLSKMSEYQLVKMVEKTILFRSPLTLCTFRFGLQLTPEGREKNQTAAAATSSSFLIFLLIVCFVYIRWSYFFVLAIFLYYTSVHRRLFMFHFLLYSSFRSAVGLGCSLRISYTLTGCYLK